MKDAAPRQHARPRRGWEQCAGNPVPAGGCDSSSAPRCTARYPCSLGADNISRGRGRGAGEESKVAGTRNGNIHGGGGAFCQEENSLALDAKHVCTRTGFKNSDRTLSVFKDSRERFVCPKPTSKSLPVTNSVREPPDPAD